MRRRNRRVAVQTRVAKSAAGRRQVDRYESFAELVRSEQLLRAALDNMPAMIAYWDRDLINLLANQAYVEWFGWTPEQMRGHHISEVIGPDLFHQNHSFLAAALGGLDQRFDRTIVDASGNTRYSQAAYIPDRDEFGQVCGIFVLVADVTSRVTAERALEASRRELEQLALSDGLTQLANRVALYRACDLCLAALDRKDPGAELLGVLVVDLDGFKPVNDESGHAAGDEVLATLGARLAREVRGPDLAARLGGDEFVILAVGLRSRADAEALAARILTIITEPVTLTTGVRVRVGASVGIALAGASRPLPTFDDLLQAADSKMYEAKAAGGGCHR